MNNKIALIVSDFNKEITHHMELVAKELAPKLKLEITSTIHVPGVYEIPYATKIALQDLSIQAAVTIGVVIRGKTDHDLVITQATVIKLMDCALEHNKPVGLGIIGPRATKTQAEERAKKYVERALNAVAELLKIN